MMIIRTDQPAGSGRRSNSQKPVRSNQPFEYSRQGQGDLYIKKCNTRKKCGHKCCGLRGEVDCMPCLEPECQQSDSRLPSGDELCAICFTSELRDEACIKLGCGHVFHANCVLKLLKHGWNTLKISFAFASCPSCK